MITINQAVELLKSRDEIYYRLDKKLYLGIIEMIHLDPDNKEYSITIHTLRSGFLKRKLSHLFLNNDNKVLEYLKLSQEIENLLK